MRIRNFPTPNILLRNAALEAGRRDDLGANVFQFPETPSCFVFFFIVIILIYADISAFLANRLTAG